MFFIISLVLIAVLTAADQLIKFAVVKHMKLGEVIKVIHFGEHKIFSLTYITNKGAAWSMMEGKTWYLIGFPVIIIIAAIVYMYMKRKDGKFLNISLALLIAGGIGNLIDRIRIREVVDYIMFEPIDFPIFNFADICVVFGVILLCVHFVFFDKSEDKPKAAKTSETEEETDEEPAGEDAETDEATKEMADEQA